MKFYKILILSLVLLFPIGKVKGESVSQKEGMKIAQSFFNQLYGEVTAPPKMVWNGRQLTTDRLFAPFYIYNSPKGGFVIISAENKAYPILAYSKTNQFLRDKLGDEENSLLSQYAHEIELIRYDGRLPVSSLSAWQNLPEYIAGIIENPYAISEYRELSLEKRERIEDIDRRNGWIVMPTAVEYKVYDPEEYRAITLDDIAVDNEPEPFSFFYDFLEEIKKEAETRNIQFEEYLNPTSPDVRPLGGGHYEIRMPEETVMVRIYSVHGAKMQEKYFSDTNLLNLNLESLPNGFYVALALTESGNIYGFKLFR